MKKRKYIKRLKKVGIDIDFVNEVLAFDNRYDQRVIIGKLPENHEKTR